MLQHLKLAAVSNYDLFSCLAALGAVALNLLDYIHAVDNLSENNVLSVEPGCLHSGDEELGTVGVGAGVSHRQNSGASVGQSKVLVLKLLAVDRLASRAVVIGEVTSLAHEVGDHTVEGGALVPEPFLSGAERTEVLGGLGNNIGSQLDNDSAQVSTVGGHIKKTSWEGHLCKIPNETSASIFWQMC